MRHLLKCVPRWILKPFRSMQHSEMQSEEDLLVESLEEGILIIDGNRQTRSANTAAAHLLGIPRHTLLTEHFPPHTYDSPLLSRCVYLLEECQKRYRILTDSISLSYPSNKRIHLDLIATPKSKKSGAILVLQDKSNHYKVLQMGRDFVANASHELRTPITIIQGFAETLYDLSELPQEILKEIVEKILRNCERMDGLIKNLLTLADLENLPMLTLQECDLTLLIEACFQVLQTMYKEAHFRIENGNALITVCAHPELLELALFNLLDNAAKYSLSPAHILVRIFCTHDKVHIQVQDQGIGIPSEDLEHIFERFYTVNKARSRQLGGAGLGLSIVKTIIEKHHGTLSVHSAVNHGTCFTVILDAPPKPLHGFSSTHAEN